ncbi:MAG: hypothetical protein OXU45_09080 [Candidatus Melainabacteria bacterium]|nr:hypothetical protein [Candidatus Melainabacteria bacterium]
MSLLSKQINNHIEQNYVAFHSPAHAGKLNPRDLSELDGLDDLQAPKEVLKDCQEQVAEIFGAKQSWFLVNGASVGMQAACLALKIYLNSINDQRPVLVARNVHKSVIAGIILAGLEVEWFEPEWNAELGIFTVIARIQGHQNLAGYGDDREPRPVTKQSNASAIIITNPTYEGFHTDLLSLRGAAGDVAIPIIVDEAHGAHYQFTSQLPATALEQGADIAVQSWHKTLGSLGQTGVLHQSKSSKIPSQYIADSLKLLQTTSPSYLLLESITEVAELYSKEGQGIVEETIRISKNIQLPSYPNSDPYRLIIPGPGRKIEELLAEQKILIEAAYENFALLFINPGNDQADITRLNSCAAAIEELCKNYQAKKISKPKALEVSSPREAFLNGQTSIEAPCPPGIIIHED